MTTTNDTLAAVRDELRAVAEPSVSSHLRDVTLRAADQLDAILAVPASAGEKAEVGWVSCRDCDQLAMQYDDNSAWCYACSADFQITPAPAPKPVTLADLCPYHDLGIDDGAKCTCPPDHPNRGGEPVAPAALVKCPNPYCGRPTSVGTYCCELCAGRIGRAEPYTKPHSTECDTLYAELADPQGGWRAPAAPCPTCKGKGSHLDVRQLTGRATCAVCKGTGKAKAEDK